MMFSIAICDDEIKVYSQLDKFYKGDFVLSIYKKNNNEKSRKVK